MLTETKVAVTTMDNPFDPIDDFTSWRRFDEEKGYNTCGILARLAHTTNDMSQKEEDEEIERAINVMIEVLLPGFYRKVKKDIPFIY